MKKSQNISLAKVGMQRDAAKDSLDEKSYTIAINMNVENEDGDLYKLKSERSNLLASKLKPGFKLLGHENDELNNRTFVLITNPTTKVSELGVIENNTEVSTIEDVERNCVDCQYDKVLAEPLENTTQVDHQTYTTLLEDSCNLCLNLDVRYPIKRMVVKNEKLGTKLFWTDNFNPPRYFDEAKLALYQQTGSDICDTDTIEATCVNCDRLRMFPQADPLSLEPDSVVLGGNLKLGQYTFYAAYANSLGQEVSEYGSITNPVSVFDDNNKILTNREELERTNSAIKLNVTDLDPKYEYYKVVVSYTNIADAGTRHYVVGTYPITNNTVLFTTEQDKAEISLNEILLPNPNIKLLEGFSEVNDYLVGYGITREKEWNLQPVVNLLGGFLKWQTHITTEDAYADGVNVSKYKGYMRDEVYPFAIEFKTNTGYNTARFPLISRPATATDLEVIANADLDSINANITNCGSGTRDKRWQLYNTAEEQGSCDFGSIPTSIVREPVVQTTTAALPAAIAGNFTIEDPEDFTTLEEFINKALENGECDNPAAYPFCSAADPSALPDLIPITDCDTPVKEREIVEVTNITGEVLTPTYISYPDDYRKLASQGFCNPFQPGSGGGNLLDTEFQETYFPGENKVPIRSYPYTNDRDRNALLLTPVEDAKEPVARSYYHNYDGATGTSPADALAQLIQPGYTGTATQTGNGFENMPFTFESSLHKNALWFKIDLETTPEVIFEIVRGIKWQELDIVPATDNTRISFFSETGGSQVALYSVIYNAGDGITFEIDYNDSGNLIVTNESSTQVINEVAYQSAETKKQIYMAIDCAISTERLNTQNKAVLTTTRRCFAVETRDWEVDFIDASYTSIEFLRTQRYIADCDFLVPIVDQCTVAPYKYGEFSYWESTETYPDNAELFDSTTLDIRIGDFTDSATALDFQLKYADGFSQDRYVLGTSTDFTCKPIRHYKFPDNKVSPFTYSNPQSGFVKSIIYPLGVTIDETVINDFLDIAVKNNLITQEQRDSITNYEIFRGDRSIDKGVVAKGLLYDMYKYQEDGKDILFSNFPYNDLGKNKLIYNKDRTSFIDHPYSSARNHNFTFHSPETEFSKPTLPSDLKVEGYLFGKSRGVFADVEDHPKYVILGRDAKKLAAKLATLEVIAEAAIIAAESAEVFRVDGGTTVSINPVGIGLNIAATALNVITGAVFKYGRFKYQWLSSFRDLGAPQNFAKYYTSVGEYNYLQTLQTEGDQLRGINKSSYLGSGRGVTVNEIAGEKLSINNVQREKSVFLTLGDHPLNYPLGYKDYDNKDLNSDLSSRFHEGETLNCSTGRSREIEKNIASPYVALKNFLPSQYGTINSVDWLSTSFVGDLKTPISSCKPIFGGDIFIARHTLKRKTPLFLTTAMGLASKTPFNYQSYGNFGEEPAFYANFLSPNKPSFDRGLPVIDSEFKFDCEFGSSNFYVEPPSKFYLYYYGIPSFLTETTINLNYRTGLPLQKDLFWPVSGDYVDWTQEKTVPINEQNTYYYNSQYSSNTRTSIGRTLPTTYSKKEFETLYDSPNGLIYSRPDGNENSLVEPWTTFRPLDKFDFPTSYGKLVDVTAIESGQVLARFDTTVAVFNSFDTIVEDGSTPETQNLGDGFKRRPVTFSDTDLGYAGSQSNVMVSTEYGHYWADAKRGQVFHVEPAARGMNEISAMIGKTPSGMRNWFKNHLPFKVLNSKVANYKDIDVDNPYNGVGITMGWDARYKRVFLTKRDYKPLQPSIYADKGFYLSTGYEGTIATYQGNGYTYDGIVGSNLQFSKETVGITDAADVYAIFDTTSMQVADGIAASDALQTWFSGFQAANPTYTGNLYIIPYSNERYVAFPTRIKTGAISVTTGGGWADISILPANLNTGGWVAPTELLLLAFVDESNSDYHAGSVASGFFVPTQPTTNFFTDYQGFIADYNDHYTYFKGALYPIVQNTSGAGGALVLQGLAAIKGRTLTQGEIDATQTTVDVSLLLTSNPYENTPIPGSNPAANLEPLEQYGWTGFYDKTSPASAVFSGAQFQSDLNALVSVGGQVTELEIATEPLTPVELTNTAYFEDVSFTVALNATTGTWVSYYDFKPNYYINHNHYFQTGINLTNDSSEFGVWSHGLTNKSFGVFYGKKYELGFEYPIKNNYSSKTLENIELWMEGRRYHDEHDYAYNPDVVFNKLWIYNNREASGELKLVPQRTLADNRKYPELNGNVQSILTTNTNDRWNINYFFNRVSKERLNQPIFNWDNNQIKKSFNNSIVKFKGKRVLEPLRGDFFTVYLGYDTDSRYEVEFKWATNKEDIR